MILEDEEVELLIKLLDKIILMFYEWDEYDKLMTKIYGDRI